MRDKILRAAADEIRIRGVRFTMSNLASRLSISKTSLYEHFHSKNELIYSVLALAIEDIHKQENEIYADPALPVTAKIRALLKVVPKTFGPINNQHIYEDLSRFYPQEFQLLQDFRQQHLERLNSLILQGIENATVRPVNLSVLRQIVTGATQNLFTYQFLAENNLTFADALSAMSDILVLGLSSSPEE